MSPFGFTACTPALCTPYNIDAPNLISVARAIPFGCPPDQDDLWDVCEVFFWRHAIPLFTVTYEPYTKGD